MHVGALHAAQHMSHASCSTPCETITLVTHSHCSPQIECIQEDYWQWMQGPGAWVSPCATLTAHCRLQEVEELLEDQLTRMFSRGSVISPAMSFRPYPILAAHTGLQVEELLEDYLKRCEEVVGEVEALRSTTEASSEYLRTALDRWGSWRCLEVQEECKMRVL